MDKKADGDICAHLLSFSTNFSEIFSISVFFRGRLNCKMCTVHTLYVKKYSIRMFTKSKFNPAHQKSVLYLEKQKSLKNRAKCAMCSAKCALCGSVRSDLNAPFQRPQKKDDYAENFRKIGRETKKMCANIPIGFFVHCPFHEILYL